MVHQMALIKWLKMLTARLRKPQDGLFTGVIDAVDTQNAMYRVTFDRPGLGTCYIPDYEVLVCINFWYSSVIILNFSLCFYLYLQDLI